MLIYNTFLTFADNVTIVKLYIHSILTDQNNNDYAILVSAGEFPTGSVEDAVVCATISIVDDSRLEGDEEFNILMTAVDSSGVGNRVVVSEPTASFTIEDNDSELK